MKKLFLLLALQCPAVVAHFGLVSPGPHSSQGHKRDESVLKNTCALALHKAGHGAQACAYGLALSCFVADACLESKCCSADGRTEIKDSVKFLACYACFHCEAGCCLMNKECCTEYYSKQAMNSNTMQR